MTVIKLTQSGKGVQVIDDFGNVYNTSVNSIHYLLSGQAKGGFITTRRMLNPTAPDRFKPSEIWDPNGIYDSENSTPPPPVCSHNQSGKTTNDDSLSVKVRKTEEQAKAGHERVCKEFDV